ncbi:retrotransposon hot spot protein (RHS), putative, partial [Trypanosoma cruzi]
MWRCLWPVLHVAWLRGRWALTVSPTGRLQCGCMAHRPSPVRVPRPTPLDCGGRNSRECPLEPAAP